MTTTPPPSLGSIRALANELISRERWSRARLMDHQRQALNALVRHAATTSPFYRDRLSRWALGGDVQLAELPVLTKSTLMAEFDRIVCDPRLRLVDLDRYVDDADGGALYLGGYRVFVTSGHASAANGNGHGSGAHVHGDADVGRGWTTAMTGGRGLFVYSRAEWTLVPANILRWMAFTGSSADLRLATIGSSNPRHLSHRAFADLATARAYGDDHDAADRPEGLRLEVGMPTDEIVAALNEFQPDTILTYPTVASVLAGEQLAGRLDIRLQTVLAGSDAITDATRARVRAAWGADLFHAYAMTAAGLLGTECPHRTGIHIAEDLVIVEAVDQQNRPVPLGVAGAKTLITNLTNYAQPLIRYEVTDRVTLSPTLCPCGRPFALIARIDARGDHTRFVPSYGSHNEASQNGRANGHRHGAAAHLRLIKS